MLKYMSLGAILQLSLDENAVAFLCCCSKTVGMVEHRCLKQAECKLGQVGQHGHALLTGNVVSTCLHTSKKS